MSFNDFHIAINLAISVMGIVLGLFIVKMT